MGYQPPEMYPMFEYVLSIQITFVAHTTHFLAVLPLRDRRNYGFGEPCEVSEVQLQIFE